MVDLLGTAVNDTRRNAAIVYPAPPVHRVDPLPFEQTHFLFQKGAVFFSEDVLKARGLCHKMKTMKTSTLSIRLDEDLEKLLANASKQTGRSRSDVAREALRRQLKLTHLETIRRRMMPLAEARGILTDEDVFSVISE
jgi:predicted transcriptional regulator